MQLAQTELDRPDTTMEIRLTLIFLLGVVGLTQITRQTCQSLLKSCRVGAQMD